MTLQKIIIRKYKPEDAQALADIYYNTIHQINIQHYTEEQVKVWAPETTLESSRWAKKFERTNPFVAIIDNIIVGFAEFIPDGHIDCFYCHHNWIGKGVGAALMGAILEQARALNIARIFVEASITAKPFFEKHGFNTVSKQTVVLAGIELTNYVMERRLNVSV
ncbi:GNAT family N-acetyltransferase [Parachlamydia acanthamoebae]|uniref:GNAT family N-acetyltransferase n=1 Tax=Parachlamydia acanthamoebae TaxID=83552 RepID=UPI00075077F3|nr:GNAT family N-acetyltransferase [Parachlamydia acanthamoebae]